MKAMQGARNLGWALVAGVVGFVGGAAVFSGSGVATEAGAQRSRFGDSSVTYRSAEVSQIITKKSADTVREVIPVPGRPVFLARTDTTIGVWERREKALVELLKITLNDTYREVVFLEDGRTFLIHTRSGVSAFTVDPVIPSMSNTP